MILLEPAGVERHAALLHGWMNQDHVVPWWDLDRSPEGVRQFLEAQVAQPHLDPWVATLDGRPFGYVETYRAVADPLATYYAAQPGDRGWHVLIGPPELLGTGLARRLGRAVLNRLFADPGVDRVMCEPDARNVRMIRLCVSLGHEPMAELDLPDKRALLMGCTRAGFAVRLPWGPSVARRGATDG